MLVGRDKDVGAILDTVTRRASCVLVGEAGIGKTAVLHAVRHELGDCAAIGAAVQPLRWMPYLALQRACGFALGGTEGAVLEAAIAALGSRVLLLDDLHWADPDTLAIVPELAHEVPIVATVRTDDPDAASTLAEIGAIGTHLTLEPLYSDAALQLARCAAPTASRAELDQLVEISGGNPLLLTCAPTGQAADDRLVALVARASEPARHALARLALYGRPSWDEECEVIGELDALGLVVRSADRGWTVRHDSFGQAAISLLSREERITIHRILAQTSTTDGERARHHLHAGEPERARVYALRAADCATSRNEHADHLAIAAATADPIREAALFLDASEALALSGRVEDGLAFAQHAAPEIREQCLRREKNIAWCAWWAAQHDLVWPAIERATDLLTSDDAEVEVTIHMLRARYLARIKWDPTAAIVEARAAVALAEREGLPVAEAYGALGSATLVNRGDDWEQWLVKSIAAARSEGLEAVEITSADTLFVAHLMAGEPAECAPLAREMIERSRILGTRTGEVQFRKNLFVARFHVEDALEETVEVGRQMLAQAINPRQRDHIESHFVLACADLGMDEEIERVLASAYGFTSVDLTAKATILWAKAEADWLAGRAAEALETAEECRALPVSGFPTHVMVEPVRQWAALDLGIDPGEPLTELLFANLVAANKESRAIVAMHRDPENSGNAGQFLAAGRSWDRVSRRNSARCALGAAEAARRSGDHDRAINILRILERELLASGRRPLLRRVHSTLRQLGAPVAAHTGTAFPPLTAAQVEVLELVGRGLETRKIARRLVVGETTIETHIRQSMQRLGVTTRLAAAVELLRRRGELTPPVRDDQRLALAREEPYAFPKTALEIESMPVAPWTLAQTLTVSTVVEDADDAARVLIAASRGASVVFGIAPCVSQTDRAELLDALGRIAPVETLDEVHPAPATETDDDLRAALQVLTEGGTVADAANKVHMSERTLHRRLAMLRKQLGLRSNVAVAREVLGSC